MALPARLLQRLPEAMTRGSQRVAVSDDLARALDVRGALEVGLPALDRILPDGGFPRGAVSEIAVANGASLATSIALRSCRAAQREAVLRGGSSLADTRTSNVLASTAWCAYVDPTGTLSGPGVAREGVALERLLVLRPPLSALARVSLRVAESSVFSVVVVDTVGAPGSRAGVSLGAWSRVVRHLALALERSRTCVLLITDARACRPLPLPVALRLELVRLSEQRLSVRVAKEKQGRVSAPQSIAWTRSAPVEVKENEDVRLPA